MEKLEIIRIAIEVVLFILTMFFGYKTFKFKDALTAVLVAAKDAVITEEEFQNIVDQIKKEIWKDEPINP
jgi:hypothetical protein